jgi:hypothetical protein
VTRVAGATRAAGRVSEITDPGGAGGTGPGQAVRTGAGLAWYRLRITIGRRWPGYVALGLLTGLLGGLALGAVTAARRTDSSYPDLLTRTNPADLLVQPQVSAYTPGFEGQLARLPQVRGVTASASFNAVTLTGAGRIKTLLETQAQLVASPDGLFTRQDKMIITSGRAADPARPDEVVATAGAAAQLGLHVGSRLMIGLFSEDGDRLRARLRLTVVGIGQLGIELVRDDIDAQTTGFLVGSPALVREYGTCCSSSGFFGLRLARGSRSVPAVEAAYSRLLVTSPLTSSTRGQLVLFVTAQIEAEAQRAIRPEAIALGVFGIVAGLAALIIGAQAISRQVYAAASDRQVLRALGASRAATVADGLSGLLGAVLAGGVIAGVIAAGLSPLTLFGPVRDAEPGRRLYADWAVLGLGLAALVIVLGAAAVFLSYRQAPHRVAAAPAGQRGSAVVRAGAAAGLPPAAIAGLRFALEPGRGRTAVPVRSVIAGAVLAVLVGAATLTFGASLSGLIARPALYGWNFSYALYSFDGYGPLPPSWTVPLLHHDPQIAATTGVYYGTLQVAGQTVPGLAMPVTAGVTPPSLTGHAIRDAHEIVLGPATLAQLHKHLGQVVTVSEGTLVPPVRLRIVGTAALPTIGDALGLHASMSTGAVIPAGAIPAAVRDAYGPYLSGPNTIFIRLRPGVSPAAGRRALARIVRRINADARAPAVTAQVGPFALYTAWVSLLPVQRPAEIVNYKAMGAMPVAVAAALAAGAMAALGVTLVTSVRRRRRDLALLKALGCTRRQLASAVAWQATITAAAGLVIGVPLGIAAGRWLWLAFARQLSAVPDPVIPAVSLAAAAAAALILANLVAVGPGWRAARTPAAVVLRAE